MTLLCRYLVTSILIFSLPTVAMAETTNSATKNPTVRIDTSMGSIQLELFPEQAPITVANFLQYAKEGFYEETIFHRVIPYFMIQGGGLNEKLSSKPTREPIVLEASNGLKNNRGTIAMARTNDVNSATAQFFINTEDNRALNHTERKPGYTVFGKVISGMSVVDKIGDVDTRRYAGRADVPKNPIFIFSVKVEGKGSAKPAAKNTLQGLKVHTESNQ